MQRYKCRACGCRFTDTPARGKPLEMKALALLLYAMGNMSFCSIARILGVSDVAVLNWVRNEARQLPEPSVAAERVIITLDEIWHFLKKKTCKFWVWRAYDPVARRTVAWVLGGRDDKTCQKLIDKVGLKGKTFIADDWKGFHRLIAEDQLFTGKDLTPACAGAGSSPLSRTTATSATSLPVSAARPRLSLKSRKWSISLCAFITTSTTTRKTSPPLPPPSYVSLVRTLPLGSVEIDMDTPPACAVAVANDVAYLRINSGGRDRELADIGPAVIQATDIATAKIKILYNPP